MTFKVPMVTPIRKCGSFLCPLVFNFYQDDNKEFTLTNFELFSKYCVGDMCSQLLTSTAQNKFSIQDFFRIYSSFNDTSVC